MAPNKNPWVRFRFLCEAVNKHGIHSPFVYRLVTRALHGQKNPRWNRSEVVWANCLEYFKPESIRFREEALDLPPFLRTKMQGLRQHPPYDLVHCPEASALSLRELLPQLHNDSVVMVSGIRRSKGALSQWEAMKAQQAVRVSLDLFHCGLLFFRREQALQHFKIRR